MVYYLINGHDIMARPIEPTPDVCGEDAIALLKEMMKPPTEEEKKFAKEIRAQRKVHIWGDRLGDE